MTMKETFWMIWRERGMGPTKMHETIASAKREAERLARSFPGERFIVLQAISACVKDDVQWEKLSVDFDIPF